MLSWQHWLILCGLPEEGGGLTNWNFMLLLLMMRLLRLEAKADLLIVARQRCVFIVSLASHCATVSNYAKL